MVLLSDALQAQIDIHSHMIPASYQEAVKAHGMEMDEGFPIPGWDVAAHLKFMDDAGIRTSVLTMPAPQPYFGDAAESAAVCRKFNQEAAALKELYPGRFMFCAALPLPDVTQRGRLTMRHLTQNETTPLRHFLRMRRMRLSLMPVMRAICR